MMKKYLKKIFPLLLIGFSLLTFLLTVDWARPKIGEAFRGYLTFKNGVVGAFYVPGWSGPREGLIYHTRPSEPKIAKDIFSKRDYLFVVLFPAFSGLLFILLGAGLYLYLPMNGGRFPLLIFHFLVGNYLILSPEFHLTHRLSYLLLGCFAFIPAPMIHFALLFPEKARLSEKSIFPYLAPYLFSGLVLIPYLYFFMKSASIWIVVEYVVLFYVVGSYLFWLARLILTFRKPQLEWNRILARSILLGQMVGFTVPLLASMAIFIIGIPFPLNLATPLTLLFPVALFAGGILGRLQQSQMQLVQSEKRAALGNLLAGLAHEINNPMTFIYSAIEPLRESLQSIRAQCNASQAAAFRDTEQLIDVMEEGATRAKRILDNFRYFSYAGRDDLQEIDLNEVLEHSLLLLTPKWKGRISIHRRFGEIPKIKAQLTEIGQVFLNILGNACDAAARRNPETATIEITTSASPSELRVGIGDNGPGIPKEVLPRIFDSFFTTKRQGEGTGLGLAISLEIVKKHRGTIAVKSELGKGSEFLITLPIG